MNISSLPSANLFLTSGRQTPSTPAHASQNAAQPADATTTISAAGQLRAALDHLGTATLGLTNTDVFAPKPLRAENSASQNQDQAQDREKQRQLTPTEPLPVFNPVPPPAADSQRAAKRDDQPDILVSLQQSVSEGTKAGFKQQADRKVSDRAAGELDPFSASAAGKNEPNTALRASASETDKKTLSLQDVAFGKEPGAKRADAQPIVAPLPAPLPVPVADAAHALSSAVNELRTAVARNNTPPTNTEANTQALQNQATRTLRAVDRQAESLNAIGIQRDSQRQFQVNAPVLQAAVARAPEQVRQVLRDASQAIGNELASVSKSNVPDNTDIAAQLAQSAPTAPRRAESAATPPEPAAVTDQVAQLGQTLDSIAASGLQLQRELARQDDQSSGQSSLLKHLNTLAHAMSP